jgi:hypothetical protein
MQIGALQIHRGRVLPIFRNRAVGPLASRGRAIQHRITFGSVDIESTHTEEIALSPWTIALTQAAGRQFQARKFTHPRRGRGRWFFGSR